MQMTSLDQTQSEVLVADKNDTSLHFGYTDGHCLTSQSDHSRFYALHRCLGSGCSHQPVNMDQVYINYCH